MNRAICITLFAIVVSFSSLAAQTNGTWTNYKDLEKVSIDYTTQQCTIEGSGIIADYYFLKLTNKTPEQIFVTFRLEYYYNGGCTTCSNDEYVMTFAVPANGTVQPDCTFTGQLAKLAVLKKYVNRNFGLPLDKFELTNITIQ